MNKLWVVTQREYLSRVKKRSFLLTTLLVPILIIGFYALMFWMMFANTGSAKRIAVVDESGYFQNKLTNKEKLMFTYPKGSFDELKDNFSESDYEGILYIPKELDIFKVNDNIKYYSTDRIGPGPKEHITGELKRRIKNLRMQELDVEDKILDQLNVDLQLPEVGVAKEEERQAASELLSGMGFLLGMLLYFVLILFGTMVMRGVKEEKTNRVVEVIMSSVKPFQLMFGKILGISFVGVTQFVIWGLVFFIMRTILTPLLMSKFNIDLSALETAADTGDTSDLEKAEKILSALMSFNYGKLLFFFIFYFLGGYLIYASMFSAVGSIVEDDNESQQFVFPVMMPIIISMGVMVSVLNDPNNTIATWASMFPLTSPIVMVARLPFDPPLWQIIVSMVLLILGVLFFIWLSAKIYRIGILMYGKKITLKELFKWLRY